MRSPQIDAVRTVLNTLIVAHHSGHPKFLDLGSALDLWACKVFSAVCWTLPSMFLLSGYLLMKGFEWATLRQKFWRRIKRLLVPMLVTNWAAVIFVLVGLHYGFVSDPKYDWWWGIRKVLCVTKGMACHPLWYLRTLVVFMIFSPVLYWGLRKRIGQTVFLALACSWCVVSTAFGFEKQMGMVIPSYSILIFGIGCILALNKVDILTFAQKYRTVLIVSWVASVALRLSTWKWGSCGILIVGQAFFWFVFAEAFGRLFRYRFFALLCESAFFVYVIHVYVGMNLVYRILESALGLFPEGLISAPGGCFIVTLCYGFVNLLLCLLVYKVLNKCCPMGVRILNGKL